MTQKSKFALTWGRKMFFSIGLLLTFLSGASFFALRIFPTDLLGWVYFVLTFVGWYGVLVSAGYFLFYKFFAKFIPSYYVLRFASLFILALLNGLILFDGYLLAHYQVHLSSMVFEMLQDEFFFESIGVTSVTWFLLAGVLFIFSLVFWFHGEKIWRTMQTRFSNPTSNWYLIFFFVCFLGSHVVYMFGNVDRLSNYFFFPQALQITDGLKSKVSNLPHFKGGDVKSVFYPKRHIKCDGKPEYSVVFLRLNELNPADLNEEVMPHLMHLKVHGTSLNNHHGTATSLEDANFSLSYSIPAWYQEKLASANSPIEMALKQSNQSLVKLTDPDYLSFSSEVEKEKFYLEISISTESKIEADKKLYDYIDILNKKNLIGETILFVTGKVGVAPIPTFMLWPDRNDHQITKFTSHYDFTPTLLEENFHCKNKISDYSFGENLFSKKSPNFFYVSEGKKLGIIDLTSSSEIQTNFETINPFPKGKELPRFMMAIEQFHYFNSPSL